MRRIVVAFLVLFTIVLSGIFLVEQRVRSAEAADGAGANDRYVKLTLGGSPNDDDGLSNHAGSGITITQATDEDRSWQPPEPVLRHTVVSGDNLSRIATEYYGTHSKALVDRILKANKIKSPTELKIGTVLTLPVEKFDRFVSDGRRTTKDVALRFYGDETRTKPILHANPNLPKNVDDKIGLGFTVFIPR